MAKTFFRILINTAVGGVLIYFWLKLVNLEEILKTLESFNPLLLIPCILLMLTATVLKALRFKVLLSKAVQIPALKIINLTFLSQLLSFTIPIRAGEVAKGVYLSTEYNLHFGKAVLWVFLDRFLDFWTVLGLSLILLLLIPTNLPQGLAASLLSVTVAASALVFLIVGKPAYFHNLAKFISLLLILKPLKEKFLKLSLFVEDCFALLKGDLAHSLKLFVLTVAATLAEGLSWYVVFYSFIPDVSVFKVWLGSMLTALTFIIPAAPGYVGSAEAAGLAVFSFGLGLNEVFASTATILVHAVSLVFILSSGIWGLYMLKFNLKLVWNKLMKK